MYDHFGTSMFGKKHVKSTGYESMVEGLQNLPAQTKDENGKRFSTMRGLAVRTHIGAVVLLTCHAQFWMLGVFTILFEEP